MSTRSLPAISIFEHPKGDADAMCLKAHRLFENISIPLACSFAPARWTWSSQPRERSAPVCLSFWSDFIDMSAEDACFLEGMCSSAVFLRGASGL